MREQLGTLKAEEDSLRKGLGIFKIEQSPSHPLQAMEKVCVHGFFVPCRRCVEQYILVVEPLSKENTESMTIARCPS